MGYVSFREGNFWGSTYATIRRLTGSVIAALMPELAEAMRSERRVSEKKPRRTR